MDVRFPTVDDNLNLEPTVKVTDPSLPARLSATALNATYLTVLIHDGTNYPTRPAAAPAGLVRYVGPTAPAGALTGDEWLDTSGADTTAPSAVTGLTAGTATTTTVPLSWTAATDNVGIAGYEYSTNGTTYTTTGSTGTTYTVTGLTASTAYTLYVRAFDAAGNRGAAASVAKTTAAPAAAWSTLVTDTFTGSDGSINGRTTTTGALNWVAPVASSTYGQAGTGIATITSNAITSTTAQISHTAQLTTSAKDVRVSATFDLNTGASTARQARVFARAQTTPAATCATAMIKQDGTLSLVKHDNTAITLTGTTTGFAKTGTLALEIVGTAIRILVNDAQVATATWPYADGGGVIHGFAAYENQATMDNFKLEVYG